MVTPKQHQKVREILASLETVSQERLLAELEQLCQGDQELCREVLSLLNFRNACDGDLIDAVEQGDITPLILGNLLANESTEQPHHTKPQAGDP
ncbi:MAG: hypothetical protein ACPGXK_01125 [Phycisphaerae bacterium]